MSDEHGSERPGNGERPPRAAQIALGILSVVVGAIAVFVLPVVFGQFIPGGLFSFWLIALVVAVILAMQINKRRGSGYGLGVAWGCGLILVVGGGLCIALINSLSNV